MKRAHNPSKPLPDISPFAAQFVDDDEPETQPRGGHRDAFLTRILEMQNAAHAQQTINGRRFWIWTGYGLICWFISMHTSGPFSFWVWWAGIAWGSAALSAAMRWNNARIESTLSAF
jgi:hypothetical protein